MIEVRYYRRNVQCLPDVLMSRYWTMENEEDENELPYDILVVDRQAHKVSEKKPNHDDYF